MDLRKRVIKEVNDFFQYRRAGDDEILEEALSNLEYEKGKVRIRDQVVKVERKRDALGVFLANVPYAVLGEGELHWDLPEKVVKVQSDALKLLEMGGLNEVATLEAYLVMEMSLRSLYSEWLGDVVIIRYKGKAVKVKDLDYRRLKLYILRKGWSKYKVKVNNETFPYSQGSLLAWAERFMDRRTSLVFRLSINVRNLLAHGEVEWRLFPTLETVKSASHASWLLFQKLREG
ncbi:MAG: hypothetical protein MPF33_00420 [Candidatus Aramenus sp.]|nr:hypothetical protein [Candidatus Aramenus sp.]